MARSGGLEHFDVSVPAPDLSGVLRLSAQTGRNQAYTDFYDNLIKREKERYEERQAERAEREEAAKDLGNEPESEGFWERLGQNALGGLEWTLDKLSRPNYAVANLYKHLEEESHRRETKGITGADAFWDDIKDIPDALGEMWDGFSGEDKTTFADVIKLKGKNDPGKDWKDSKWTQGIAGFGLDVLLDPTTYIGVGLVSKPIKKAMGEGVNKKAEELAGHIADLPGNKIDPNEIPMTKEHIYGILTGKPLNASRPVGKTRRLRRSQQRMQRTANKTAAVRSYINNIEHLKNQIRRNPNIDNSEIARLEAAVEATRAAHKKALDDYGNMAYRDAYVKAAPDIKPQHVPEPDFNINDIPIPDRTAKVGAIASAFNANGYARRQQGLTDNSKFYERLPGFAQDSRLTAEQKEQILEETERRARRHPSWKSKTKRIDEAKEYAKSQKNAGEAAKLAGNDAQGAISAAARSEAKVKRYYRELDEIKATVFLNLWRHAIGDKDVLRKLDDPDMLLARKAELEQRLADNDNPNVISNASVQASSSIENTASRLDYEDQLDRGLEFSKDPGAAPRDLHGEEGPEYIQERLGLGESTADNPNGIVSDAVRELQDELREIDNLLDEMVYGVAPKVDIPLSDSARKKFVIDDDFMENPGDDVFAKAVVEAVNDRADELEYVGRESFLRRRREQLNKERNATPEIEDDVLKRMFGGTDDNTPLIEVNGKSIRRDDKAALAAAGIDDFAEEFARQWNYDLGDAIGARHIAKGNYITVGWPAKAERKITPVDYLEELLDNPDNFAIGLGWRIPVPGKGDRVSWAEFQKSGGSVKDWKKHFRKYIDDEAVAGAPTQGAPAFDTKFVAHARKLFRNKVNKEKPKRIKPDYDARIPADELAKIEAKAQQDARKEIQAAVRKDEFHHSSLGEANFYKQADVDDLKARHQAALNQARMDADVKIEAAKKAAAEGARAAKLANPRGNSKPAKLQAELKAIQKELDETRDALNKAYDEAVKTRDAMANRLDEQFLIDMLDDLQKNSRAAIQLRFAGKDIPGIIPIPRLMIAATEKLAGIEILQKAGRVWGEAFSPGSRLSPELNEARLAVQGRVNDVIKNHVDEIFHAFRKFKPEDQKAVLDSLRNGVPVGNKEIFDIAHKFLDDFRYYTSGNAIVGEEAITLSDLNKFLPEKFKFVKRNGDPLKPDTVLDSVEDIIKHMPRLTSDDDVMKVIWNLRIAAEKASADKAMKFTIAESYGIKRNFDPLEAISENALETQGLINALRDKHGWTTIDGFNEKYFFSPEAADEIRALMKMMRPENTQEIMRVYDKALRVWKATVTVYNPGYYTRNGIGEVIMGLFDGLNDPRFYQKAGQVLKHAMPDDVQETLKSLETWKTHQTFRQAGARKVTKKKFRLDNGETTQLSVEDIWVLYNQYNLKSGFISTEYEHYFPAANKIRATPVGQVASRINDKVRTVGEKYEDYFRLAHFIYRLEKSGHRTAKGAAQEAAQAVRKYHFDYTDFTPFEKTKMMRIFPFYKWTRKAMPLMAGMLFTNPGKVMFYPKFMQNASYATGGTDPFEDENGFYPNYEEVTPDWMQSLMAYPMGADEDQTYMNVATPAFDVYKMFNNPVSATIGMITPAIKFPFEQATGETMDPGFKMDVKEGDERYDHLMRTTPATSYINNIRKGFQEDNESAWGEPDVFGSGMTGLDERTMSFLTGLGFYENNEARKKGEEMRRNLEGSR